LTAFQVVFISLGEALDLTTPSGRALAGMLAVFERDILRLFQEDVSKRRISRRIGISRGSARNLLGDGNP
jgi:DNA invertase Pin-like site-specific DNA recombinase